MTDKIHLWLPSNNTTSENNTRSRFITRLPSALNLEEKWECGLAEISYTKSWFNITKPQVVAMFEPHNDSYMLLVHEEAILKPGFYSNIDDLLAKINELFKKYCKICVDSPPVLKFSKNMQLALQTYFPNSIPVLGDELSELLGFEKQDIDQHLESFDDERWTFSKNKFKPFEGLEESNEVESFYWSEDISVKSFDTIACRNYDLTAGISNLYVYSNITEPTIVGNFYAPLLRTVEVPSTKQFGEQINIYFKEIYFLPITSREITTIQINLTDDTKKLIPFKFGRTIVHLILRKKSV
jgi:hypothetical protein